MLISTLTSSTLLHRCPGISNSCQDQFKLQFIIPEEKPSSQLKNAKVKQSFLAEDKLQQQKWVETRRLNIMLVAGNKAVLLSNSLPHGWTQKWTKSPCPLTWWCLVLGAPDTYRIESGPLEWSLTKSSCLRMNGWGRKMKNIMANCLGMKTQTCWPSICKLIKNKNLTQLSHQELIVETLHGYQA